MGLDELLKAIGSQEESSFGEICNALGSDCPERGDRDAWREFFSLIRKAKGAGLIDTFEDSNGKFEAAILTEAGVAKVRGAS